MKAVNRREFLRGGALGVAAVAACSKWRGDLLATPYDMPIGLMQYALHEEMGKDFEGALKQVAEIGYREIEMYEFYQKPAAEIRSLLNAHGLACPSVASFPAALKADCGKQIDYAGGIGARFLGCAIMDEPDRTSLDGFRRSAELYNRYGEQCRKAGIQFFCQNHNFEFKVFDGVVAYDELLRRTDPGLVAFEMDCFWAAKAGKDPVEYLTKHPGRFPLLHIKDLKPGFPPSTQLGGAEVVFTEVGSGAIDWKRIFAAAGKAGLRHFFVGTDPGSRPPLESIRVSYDYLKSLKV